MRIRLHILATLIAAVSLAGVGSVWAQTQPAGKAEPAPTEKAKPGPLAKPTVNPDAATLKDFTDRVTKYVALHNDAAKGVPPMKTTTEPEQIVAAQKALAAAIRAKRPDAAYGDIFTPEIRAKFRRLLSPQVKGEDGRDAKAILKDDAPVGVPLKVNADYPEGKTLPTVPAKLLLNLPTLPKEVEYRFVDKHLILRDAQANIIVDFIPNALP